MKANNAPGKRRSDIIWQHIQDNRPQFEREKSEIQNKSDYASFKKKWFNLDEWDKKSPEEIRLDMNAREPFEKDGYIWLPLTSSYNVPPELRYEYELFHWLDYNARSGEAEVAGYIFEPDDDKFPDVGKFCEYCLIYAESNKPKTCPLCGRRLFRLNLDDD